MCSNIPLLRCRGWVGGKADSRLFLQVTSFLLGFSHLHGTLNLVYISLLWQTESTEDSETLSGSLSFML